MGHFLGAVLFIFAFTASARDLDKQYDKAKFRLGKTEFEAYVADDPGKRAEGLMFIEKMPADTGMLFVFDNEEPLGFWMKNTLIPLAIGFFNAKAELVDVQEMRVADSIMSKDVPTYQSAKPALFALEMNKGWFDKHKIKKGSRLELVSKTSNKLLKSKLGSRQ